MTERSGVRVAVERDHAVAAVGREGVAGEEAGARLADAALARDEGDLPAAADGRLDARDELAMAKLGGARADADEAARQLEQWRAASRSPVVAPGVRSIRSAAKSAADGSVLDRVPGSAAAARSPLLAGSTSAVAAAASERHRLLRLRPQGSVRDLAVFSGHDRLLSVDLLATRR